MTHSSRFSVVGHLTPATIALARTARNAVLAAEHKALLAHDDVLFDAAVAAADALCTAIDPSHAGVDVVVGVETGCSDPLHLSPYLYLTKSWRLPNFVGDTHSWGMTLVAPLTPAEQALAASNLAALLQAHGRTVEPADSVVMAGFVAGTAVWLLAAAPSAPSVRVDMHATVGNGSLGRVSASLGIVTPIPASAAVPDPLAGVLTPPALGLTTHNYDPAGLASATYLRLTSTAAASVTGLAGGSGARELRIINIGAQTINLRHNNSGSLAPNRFQIGADLGLAAGRAAILAYDPVALCWRVVAARS